MNMHGMWALVTNGVRARILTELEKRGAAPAGFELVSKAKSTHLRDILSDKSGRSFASHGGGLRSAMEPGGDPILRDMQDFAKDTIALLEHEQRQKSFDALGVFASPRMLGILREEMPATLKRCVILEKPANLVQLPPAELREAVRKALETEATAGNAGTQIQPRRTGV